MSPSLGQDRTTSNKGLALFLVSVLGLFLEMVLIRWIGTEIRIFAYLQNTILVVCFLGLGVGCFTSQSKVDFRVVIGALLGIIAVLSIPPLRNVARRITSDLSVLDDFVIWESASASGWAELIFRVLSGLALTLVLTSAVWFIFLHQGRLLGRLMGEHPHVVIAYSYNIAGSLVGIWLYVGLCAMSTPPAVWVTVTGLLLLPFLSGWRSKLVTAGLFAFAAAITAMFGADRAVQETVWSPYQKLELTDNTTDASKKGGWVGKYVIMVNNVPYQGIIDLDKERVLEAGTISEGWYGWSQYDMPFKFKPNPRHTLIVGAGAGNDVAGALRGGSQQVTAVEIDPAIIQMGTRYHPEAPYRSPKVKVVNDDARAYFAATEDRFDLIVFGLLDSHTTTSMTNARLDHYVYTLESIQRARDLLTPDGMLVLTFEAQKAYIVDRMAGCLRQAFGEAPLMFRIPAGPAGWGGVMFVSRRSGSVVESYDHGSALGDIINRWDSKLRESMPYITRVATDDWPYLYLSHPRIPLLHMLLAAMLGGLAIVASWRSGLSLIRGWDTTRWHFFFLGAAFMLLEVQNVSKAAVVLGNTWQINAVVISGILVMVLIANVLAVAFPRISRVAAIPLIAICVGLYFVDLARFASFPYWSRVALVGTLTTLPVLFSGLLFIDSFRASQQRDAALGANLFGSLAGGLLQSLSFLTGVRGLMILVAGFYLLAALTRPKLPLAAKPKSEKIKKSG